MLGEFLLALFGRTWRPRIAAWVWTSFSSTWVEWEAASGYLRPRDGRGSVVVVAKQIETVETILMYWMYCWNLIDAPRHPRLVLDLRFHYRDGVGWCAVTVGIVLTGRCFGRVLARRKTREFLKDFEISGRTCHDMWWYWDIVSKNNKNWHLGGHDHVDDMLVVQRATPWLVGTSWDRSGRTGTCWLVEHVKPDHHRSDASDKLPEDQSPNNLEVH